MAYAELGVPCSQVSRVLSCDAERDEVGRFPCWALACPGGKVRTALDLCVSVCVCLCGHPQETETKASPL